MIADLAEDFSGPNLPRREVGTRSIGPRDF